MLWPILVVRAQVGLISLFSAPGLSCVKFHYFPNSKISTEMAPTYPSGAIYSLAIAIYCSDSSSTIRTHEQRKKCSLTCHWPTPIYWRLFIIRLLSMQFPWSSNFNPPKSLLTSVECLHIWTDQYILAWSVPISWYALYIIYLNVSSFIKSIPTGLFKCHTRVHGRLNWHADLVYK